MRSLAPLIAAALLLASCGGDADLSAEEERAVAAAPTNPALPEGWEVTELFPTEPGDPVPEVEGCGQLAALDVSDATGFVTASIESPDADLPLLDVDLDLIVMPSESAAAAYVRAVADPATPSCLVALDEGGGGVEIVDTVAPVVVDGEAMRLRFDFPPTEDEAAATFEVVAMANADLLAVVEIAYATEVPPPGLDAVLAAIADRLAAAP